MHVISPYVDDIYLTDDSKPAAGVTVRGFRTYGFGFSRQLYLPTRLVRAALDA